MKARVPENPDKSASNFVLTLIEIIKAVGCN